MDEQTKLLQEIRDALRENGAAIAEDRRLAEAHRVESMALHAEAMRAVYAGQRFYRRVIAGAAVLLVILWVSLRQGL